MMRAYVLAIISFLLFYAGSCDKEHIEGYIEYDRDEVCVNDSLFLRAFVTSATEPFDVSWDYWPLHAEASLISPVPGDTGNGKYHAVFVSKVAGEFTISVRFLHRNTAPKESDAVLIKVSDCAQE